MSRIRSSSTVTIMPHIASHKLQVRLTRLMSYQLSAISGQLPANRCQAFHGAGDRSQYWNALPAEGPKGGSTKLGIVPLLTRDAGLPKNYLEQTDPDGASARNPSRRSVATST